MELSNLLAVTGEATVTGDPDVTITAVVYDSRRATPGSLYCCLVGADHDGHDFAPEAIANGAVALVVDRPLALDVPQVQVADTRLAMALIAAAFEGHPSRHLDVIGITGTNGKTTTTYFLRNIFEAAGRRTEVLGTLTGARTTPEAPDLQRQLATWRDEGVSVVAMEVSSHALDLHRVDGTRFRVAVFTNLSRDHLDYHGTVEAYFEAKARLFDPDLSDAAVVNLDSPHGRLLRDVAQIPTTGFSLDDVTDLVVGAASSRFTWRGQVVELGIGGTFNVSNALAAAETALVLGLDPAQIAPGLSEAVVVPGRFEHVDAGQPFTVLVDYAHTPDGLDQVLTAAREILQSAERTVPPDGSGSGVARDVIVVFGCGGDRDASKRPAMGEVAARLSDRVVLTADNSRREDTGAIIEAVKEGFDRASSRRARDLVIEPDRRSAIATALVLASPGDIVVVAGKGHESTLIIGDTVIPFDDRQVVREELARLGQAHLGQLELGLDTPGTDEPGAPA
jgi:UDP-N-acetylmuramoyl-L-alanyl-D-glutamate--2,6-diaminopimelate ligase